MLITGNSISLIKHIINQLKLSFSLKELGQAHHLLGIQTTKTAQGIHLSQAAYIRDVLSKAQMQYARPTPVYWR